MPAGEEEQSVGLGGDFSRVSWLVRQVSHLDEAFVEAGDAWVDPAADTALRHAVAARCAEFASRLECWAGQLRIDDEADRGR
ncbi:hypothetical protein EP7_005685 (plasmid) [Isosphaeraceae bacterium EP7]